jgi:hypothetical protein
MKRLFTLFLLFNAFATATFAQNNQVVFSFDHKIGSEQLVLNQTIFPIWNNKNVIITRAQFYLSEIGIQLTDGTLMPITDQYILVNANTPNAEFDLGSWPLDAAHGTTLHLGVPKIVNHNDPATYPADHPLALQNPTMHWGWSSGYRFIAIEGKVDNNGDGVPETAFEYHNLGDALYKSLQLTGTKNAENGILNLHLVIDYSKLFMNMTLSGNLIQHGSAAANVAMMNNAATQNFIVWPTASSTHEVITNSLNIKTFPNPANAETLLEYNLPASGLLELTLGNTLGQTVRSIHGLSTSGVIRIETATLPEGIYQCAFYENSSLIGRKQLIVKH